MTAIAVPIASGKMEIWKGFAEDLAGPRADEFAEFNERMGLTNHKAWLQETPEGHIVIALQDGPGAEDFIPKLGQSDHPFDAWFRGHLEEIHGMNLSEPLPGGLPRLFIDG